MAAWAKLPTGISAAAFSNKNAVRFANDEDPKAGQRIYKKV